MKQTRASITSSKNKYGLYQMSLWRLCLATLLTVGMLSFFAYSVVETGYIGYAMRLSIFPIIAAVVALMVDILKNITPAVKKYFIPTELFGIIVTVVIYQGGCLRGAVGFLNCYIAQWNIRRDMDIGLIDVFDITENDVIAFLFIAGYAAAWASWEIVRRRSLIGTGIATLLMVGLMILSGKISTPTLAIMTMSVLGIWMYRIDRYMKLMQAFWLGVFTLLMVAISIPLSTINVDIVDDMRISLYEEVYAAINSGIKPELNTDWREEALPVDDRLPNYLNGPRGKVGAGGDMQDPANDPANKQSTDAAVEPSNDPADKSPDGDQAGGAVNQPTEPAGGTTTGAAVDPAKDPSGGTTTGAAVDPAKDPAGGTTSGAAVNPAKDPSGGTTSGAAVAPTPGTTTDAPVNAGANDHSMQPQGTTTPGGTVMPSQGMDDLTRSPNAGIVKTPEEQAKSKAAVKGLIALIIILLTLALFIALAWNLIRLWLRNRRIAAISEEDRVKLLCSCLYEMLEAAGIEVRPGYKDEDIDARICELAPDIKSGTYVRVADLIKKYLYGGYLLRPHEKRVIQNFMSTFIRNSKNLGLRARLQLMCIRLRTMNIR